MNYEIVVGIMTFNEESTIQEVTTCVDNGLSQNFPDKKCLIINCDSNSQDNTVVNFKNTITNNSKEVIVTLEEPRGKGRNMFSLLQFVIDRNISCIATVDGDLRSIEPLWMKLLLDPIINNRAKYVSPVYTRNRFEGSATNHFCVPFLDTFFEQKVTQPIGGEFAFNLEYAKYLMKTPIPTTANQYGIDIFMTTHALGGGFKIEEVFLGRKWHNPSFGKMVPMFEQIIETVIHLMNYYQTTNNNLLPLEVTHSENKHVIDAQIRKPDEQDIIERKNNALMLFQQTVENCPPSLKDFVEIIISNNYNVDKNTWESILSTFFQINTESIFKDSKTEITNYVKIMTSFYLFRVLTFYNEIEDKVPNEIEEILNYRLVSV